MNTDITNVVAGDLNEIYGEVEWCGSVDELVGTTLRGWIVSAANPLRPVQLEIAIAGELVLTTVCSKFRDDIARHMRLPLKAGFEADLKAMSPTAARRVLAELKSWKPQDLVRNLVQVRVAGTLAALPFSVGAGDELVATDYLRTALIPIASSFDSGSAGRIRVRDSLSAPLPGGDAEKVNAIAYYLPQFHPFAENNEWWGTGFTEWTNVTTAKPYFEKHYQPHLPADLGYYDLRVEQIQRDQIDLAKRYGLSGFCYYYYWFSGQSLMTMPIDRHVDAELDFDFCLCWANESWSRRWDGSENDVLIAQRHTFESDVEFINSCIKYFQSPRYIRIDGAPLLQVYRISLLENPIETIATWREIVREAGFPDLHVCMVESFGLVNPHEYGCDSSCQFPPHGVVGKAINDSMRGIAPGFTGTVYDYSEIVRSELARPNQTHVRFRGAMLSWDNTSRKGSAGNVFFGASPELFETWLQYLVHDAVVRLPEGKRFVFINAWNEWAEGTHLEPDRQHGHGYLQAVRNALMPSSVALAPLFAAAGKTDDPLSEARRYVESLQNTNKILTQLVAQPGFGMRLGEEKAFAFAPSNLLEVAIAKSSFYGVDSINGRGVESGAIQTLASWQGLGISGWSVMPGLGASPMLLSLRNTSNADGGRYVCLVNNKTHRHDVAVSLSLNEDAAMCGFSLHASLRGVPKGLYELEILHGDDTSTRKAIASATSVLFIVG